jgi:PQQ-like domain
MAFIPTSQCAGPSGRRRFSSWRAARCVILSAIITATLVACTGGPSAQQSHAAPSLGNVSLAWKFAGQHGASLGATAYDQRRHVLYYVSSSASSSFDTVSAVNVATGELLWQNSFASEQQSFANHISGLLVYQNYLVVAPDPTALMLDGTQLTVWILDPATGSIERQIGVAPKAVVAGVSHGNAIIEEDTSLLNPDGNATSSPVLAAYSLSSGEEMWHESAPCDHGQVADDTAIVVACDSAVEGLDPADGSTLWRYHVTDGWGSWQVLYLSGGVIEAREGNSVTFLDEHGRKIIAASTGTAASGEDPVYFGVAGPDLIIVGLNSQNRLAVTSASMQTGQVQKQFVMPAGIWPTGNLPGTAYFPAGLSIDNSAVYLPVSLPRMFMGNALLEINVADGSRLLRLAPAQLSSAPANTVPGLPPAAAVTVNGSALLIAHTSATSDGLTAFRATPPVGQSAPQGIGAFRGASGHWPGACSLLPPADRKILAASLGAQYQAQQVTQSLGPGLPAASTCYYVSSAATSGNITVRVAWDGDTAADARAILAAGKDESATSPLSGPWDLGYDFSNETVPDGFEMTVGTLDIVVSSTFRGTAQRFAAGLASSLRSRNS